MDCSIPYLFIGERVERTGPYRHWNAEYPAVLVDGARVESTGTVLVPRRRTEYRRHPHRLRTRGPRLPGNFDTHLRRSRVGRAGRPGNMRSAVGIVGSYGVPDHRRHREWRHRGKNLVSAAEATDFRRFWVGPKHVASSYLGVKDDYVVCNAEGTAYSYRKPNTSLGGRAAPTGAGDSSARADRKRHLRHNNANADTDSDRQTANRTGGDDRDNRHLRR